MFYAQLGLYKNESVWKSMPTLYLLWKPVEALDQYKNTLL